MVGRQRGAEGRGSGRQTEAAEGRGVVVGRQRGAEGRG